ncbi:MAG TPA: BTAD domain-containing putative transcriptional regulator [Streptosporangiaceae bacterium]|nr:BTAD domain-containing putative transcriptional regulator [Streptosporangiaceae bacterium]
MTRARTVGIGLAALALLAAAVIGLPAVLYRFGGSPLPHHLASWRLIWVALSRQDGASLLLAIVRDCSWLAWLLFTACVLAEAQAAIFSRRSPQLRLGGMQGVAAHLVALAALAFAAPSAIALSPVAPAPVALSAIIVPPSPAAHPGLPQLLAADSGPVKETRLITVSSGDCLWSIARRYLGAGDRYPEIVRLNYGRDMGHGVVFANPALIEPGWHLFLPASRAGASHAAASRRTGSHHLGHATSDPHYRRRHPAARQHAADRHAGSSPAGNVVAEPRRNPSPRVVPGQSSAAAARQVLEAAPYQTSASAAPASDQLPQAAVFVTGALAGAVLSTLTRLRWRQRQGRRRGRRIALPADLGVLAAEQRLRAAVPAETVPLETLRDALASLAAGIAGAGLILPEIVGLHVTPDVLEVLLGAPAPEAPPEPYVISPGRQGMCWQLDLPAATAVPGDPASGDRLGGEPARPEASLACHLLPGLVTVGATGTGYLLLDLESLQVTGCDGPPGLVGRVVSTAATELAAAQWSGWYNLILVGCDELEVLGRAEHCGTLDEALSMIEARCAAVGPRIAARAPADVRELRLAEPENEDWSLTILISRAEPDPAQLLRLLELAEDGPGGIAALVAGDPETPDGRMAPTVLQLAPDPQAPDGIIANVVPLQIAVRPRALCDADYDAIATLFAVAADGVDVGMTDEPYQVYAAPPWLVHAEAAEPYLVPEPDGGLPPSAATVVPHAPHLLLPAADMPSAADEASPLHAGQAASHQARLRAVGGEQLRVRVLGPFMIAGAEELQPKQAELVLALALAAPAGLSNSALCSILGADPDHPKPGDAVRQIITRTRRRLGPASDGQEFIIHAGSGRYLLHPDASLDWAEFRELVASGKTDELRAAVSMIGGQPFTGSYFWWIDVPLIETMRAELVDAAETLAELELAGGSARAAARAARAGLLAEPSAEQLWRMLMRAEHATGSMAGLTETWRRCLEAIEEIAPGGEPHPDTAVLYRQLSARPQHYAPRHHAQVR